MVVVDPNCRPWVIDAPDVYRARLEHILADGRPREGQRGGPRLAGSGPAGAATRPAPCSTYGPKAVLLTRGPDGATIVSADAKIAVPAVPVDVVDTIGAGDAFGGGFLAWWSSHGLGARRPRRAKASSSRPRASPRSSRRARSRRRAPHRPRCRPTRRRRWTCAACKRARRGRTVRGRQPPWLARGRGRSALKRRTREPTAERTKRARRATGDRATARGQSAAALRCREASRVARQPRGLVARRRRAARRRVVQSELARARAAVPNIRTRVGRAAQRSP